MDPVLITGVHLLEVIQDLLLVLSYIVQDLVHLGRVALIMLSFAHNFPDLI